MDDPTALYERARRRPEAIDRSEVTALGEALGEGLDPDLLAPAVGAVAEATRADTRVGVPVVPELAALSSHERPAVRRRATTALARVAAEHPDAVSSTVDRVVEGLEVESDPEHRSTYVLVLARIAEAGTGQGVRAVAPTAGTIAGRLDEDLPVRATAARALAAIAAEDPERVTDAVPELLDCLDAPVAGLRVDAARAVAAVAEADPESIAARVGSLVATLDDGNRQVRRSVAQALSALALADPPAVAPHDEALISLLGDAGAGDAAVEGLMGTAVTDPEGTAQRLVATIADAEDGATRTDAERTLRGIAMRNPDPVVAALADVLDHDRPAVRRTAVGILATIADHRPGRVVDVAGAIAARLGDDEVEPEAAAALASMAAECPAELAGVAPTLSEHVALEGAAPDAAMALAAILVATPDAVDHPPAVGTLLRSEEATNRASGCRILGVSGDATAIDRLRKYAEDDTRTVRVAALEGMARLAERGEVTLDQRDRERIAAVGVSIDEPDPGTEE